MPSRLLLGSVVVVAFAAIGVAACKPDFGERESLVTRTVVLAVRGDPPEAAPGETVTYSALVASPEGEIAAAPASWAFCATPKLLTENGAVSAACLASGVRAIAEGLPSVVAPMPTDACFLFGPEVSSADLRPRDPDVSGGYYQPVRVHVMSSGNEAAPVAFGLERVRCNLSSAGAEVATDFQARYVTNVNPEIASIEAHLTGSGAPVAFDAIPRRATITLRATWPTAAAEDYVALDVATQTVASRRETMRVSWFATTGSFESDRTGRDGTDRESFSENAWTAPEDARAAHLFVVLRDARGGVAWRTVPIAIR